MRKRVKKIILAVISVISVSMMIPYYTVSAEGKGNIEITETATNTTEKEGVAGVKLGLYKVADKDSSREPEYKMTELFADAGMDVTDILYSEHPSDIARTLEEYTVSHSIEPQSVAVSNTNGYLSFNGLSDGIYLIRQVNTDDEFESLGYKYSTDPYIIALPSLDESGKEIRNVVCQPKGILTKLEKKDTSLTVYKLWKDDNNKKGIRPEKIKVGLYDGNKLKEEVSLSAGNNWMYAWGNLDKDGKWSVKELEIPRGYTSSITNNDQNWTITNTCQPKTLVKTGDDANIIFWIIIAGLSICVIVSAIRCGKRYKRTTKQ